MQSETKGSRSKAEILLEYLTSLNIQVAVHHHPPVFTVEESIGLRGMITGGHSKNLFLIDRKKNLYLISSLEDCTINLKNLHSIVGAKGKFSFASAKTMETVLGVQPGAVSPFGILNDKNKICRVVLDGNFFTLDQVNFHPLDNSITCTIKPDDLLTFLKATGHEPQILDLQQ